MDYLDGWPEPEETDMLKKQLELRNQLDKKLQGLGNKFFQANSGGAGTGDEFKNCLYHVDQAHQGLVNFVKQYLPDTVVASIFINEKLERRLKILESENVKLRIEKLKQCSRNIIKKTQQEFYEGETKAGQGYSEPETYSKSLEEESKHFQSQAYMQPINNVSHDNLKLQAKIQMQEEIIKAQRGLIDNSERLSLDQKANEQKQIQTVQQGLENEIYQLKTTEQQFQELLQEHQTLQKQMSTFEARFKEKLNNLQQHSISQASTTKKLQETLNFTINDGKELEEELAKRNLHIRSLNSESKRDFHEAKDALGSGNNEVLKKTFAFGENKEEVPESQNKDEGPETKHEFHEVKGGGSGKYVKALKKILTFGENKEEVPEGQNKGRGQTKLQGN